MKHYIGLDAHSATCTFVVVDESGDITHRAIVKTSEGTLLGFLGTLSGEKILAVEESHVSQWVYVLLHDQVDKLIVCNPCRLSKHQGPKTDYRDALRLAQELRGNFLQAVYHDESHWIQLRVLVSGYLDLISEIVRSKNRLKAVFRSEIIDTSGAKFYSSKERSKELSHEHGRFVAESLFSQVEHLEQRKLEFRAIFVKNMKIYRPLKNLATIPGIDAVRANIIMAIVCMPRRRDCKTISRSTDSTDLSPFISKIEIARALTALRALRCSKRRLKTLFVLLCQQPGSKPELPEENWTGAQTRA